MSDIESLQNLSGQLKQGAQKFSSASQSLSLQARGLDWSAQDLANGASAWAGKGSQNFTTAWNTYHQSTQKSITALNNTAQTLTKLAQKIDDTVQQLQDQQAQQSWLAIGLGVLTVGLVVVDVLQLGLDPVTDGLTVAAGSADAAAITGSEAAAGTAEAAAQGLVEVDAQIAGDLDEIASGIDNVADSGDIAADGGTAPGDINVDEGPFNDSGNASGGNGGGNNGGGNGPVDGGTNDPGGGDPNEPGGSGNGGSNGGSTPPATTEESVAKKLNDYLLNPDHPVGGPKAKWFRLALGFTKDNADKLAQQIVFNPSTAVETGVTQFGTKFNQVISIVGENGKTIDVVFAWIRNNDGIVRLVTAIPPK